MFDENAIDDYLRYCARVKRLSPETMRAYRADLDQYHAWLAADGRPPCRDTALAYVAHLNASCAPASVKRKVAAVRTFMSYLLGRGDLDANPFAGLGLRLGDRRRLPRTIPRGELASLFAHLRGNGAAAPAGGEFQVARDLAIVELLIATGLRVSELCALDLADVDLAGRTLIVHGKGGKDRIAQLGDDRTASALSDYIALRARTAPNGEAALFLSRLSRRMSDRAVRDMVARRAAEAGVTRHITPHMYRHTFATLLLEGGTDIRYIQQLLGHSSLRTTEIYTHVASAKLREIMRTNNPRNAIDA